MSVIQRRAAHEMWGSMEMQRLTWRFGLWLASCASLLLVACSGDGDQTANGDAVAHKVEALANPVTLKLQTPGAVRVLSPVVAVANSMSLGAATEIVSGAITTVGGGLHTEPDALLNETWSRGTA